MLSTHAVLEDSVQSMTGKSTEALMWSSTAPLIGSTDLEGLGLMRSWLDVKQGETGLSFKEIVRDRRKSFLY